MEALSYTISIPALTLTPLPPATSLCRNGFRSVILRSKNHANRICKSSPIFARIHQNQNDHRHAEIDFTDPDWKSEFQRDFEKRFKLPHITDIFEGAKPIPSTFCLRMRTPVNENFVDGYPSDEKWHGYINNNDRVLLKVINYLSPTSAGAECIDPDCTGIEQWKDASQCCYRVHSAGPREEIYFKPEKVKAAILTCGGLCPGLNDVIRHIVITLEIYGVKNIVGIPFGYRGFCDKELTEMLLLRKWFKIFIFLVEAC